MRGYRPSRYAESHDDEEEFLMDPERLRRIVVYCRRARNGQPLFEKPVKVSVKHFQDDFRPAKAG